MELSLFHNGILIAVLAHGLIGASLVWDKVLLRRPHTGSVLSYVFWLGSLGGFGLVLIPFGFHMPGWKTAVLAFGTGLLHQVAICFYYVALKRGEASQTLAIMGGFSPVATLLIGVALLHNPLDGNGTMLGFALLVTGGFMMFFSEPLDLGKVLPSVLVASGVYGLVNVLQKLVFNDTNFVTGYVIFTFGQFIGSLGLLLRPAWRREIFEQSEQAEPQSRFWYFVNRFISGVGSFLVFYAISLTRPALVDAITGLRYVIIFAGAYALTVWRPKWLREDFTGRALLGKVIATALVLAGLVMLGLNSSTPGSSAATPDELQLQESHATGDQSCRHPSPPVNVLPEHVLGQESFHHVTQRGSWNRKAYIGNREQRKQGEKGNSHCQHASQNQRVMKDSNNHAPYRARLELFDLALPLHAGRVQDVACGSTSGNDSDEQPRYSPMHTGPSAGAGVVREGVFSAIATPKLMMAMPAHRISEIFSPRKKYPATAISA